MQPTQKKIGIQFYVDQYKTIFFHMYLELNTELPRSLQIISSRFTL